MRIVLAVLMLPLWVSEAAADWSVHRKEDPFNDTVVVSAMTSTAQGTLVVRCSNRKFEMYVDVDNYLSNGAVDFRYRLDDQPTIEDEGSPSADGTAVFIGHAATKARPFMAAGKVLFEVFDFRGVGHRRSFSLKGSMKAISAVMEACDVRETTPEDIDATVVKGVDSWPADVTVIAKEILSARGRYAGPMDSSKPDALYAAVQAVKPEFLRYCKEATYPIKCSETNLMWGGEISTYELILWATPPDMEKRVDEFILNR